MTEQEITDLVANAAQHSRSLSRFQASMFLMCREIVSRGPSQPQYQIANDTVERFSRYIMTGVEDFSFTMFTLPVPDQTKTKHAPHD